MDSRAMPLAAVPLLAAILLLCPAPLLAQGFSADYGLTRATQVPADAVRLAGGYRWADGQSLTLQVTRGRGPERLGLAVSYDWPRYFVRLSYDTGLAPLPQDRLRLSAGMRF